MARLTHHSTLCILLLSTAALCAGSSIFVSANIKLPALLSDGMVPQPDSAVALNAGESSAVPSRPVGYPSRESNLDVLPGFKTPPPGYGEVAFYWWLGDTLTRERIEWQMDQLKDKGVTGLQINYAHSDSGGNIWGLTFPSQPALFSDEWWQLFVWFLQEARERQMSVSVSDYTLGHAGQGWYVDEILRENPQLAGSKLLHVEREFGGGVDCCVDVPDNILTARAYRLHGDGLLSGFSVDLLPMISGKQLRWRTPAGDWKVILVHRSLVPRSFDPMHPLTGKKYNEKFFQRFEDHCPGETGAGLNFFFSDELDFGIRGYLWNDSFAAEFRKRKGYDVLPELPSLFADIGPRTPKVRMDYNDVMVSLSEEHFFIPLYDWHTVRGMLFGCDHGGRGLDVTEFGDYFRTQRWMSGPGCDQPFLQQDIVKNKVASSIAHLYERPRTWLEGYHSSNWGTSSADVAEATFANYAMGQNLLSLHGLYYSTHGGWWEWAPPDNHWRQPYWAHMGEFLKCSERLSYVLSQGYHRCDVALLYPVAPMEAGMDGENAVALAFAAGRALYSDGIDFDYMDFESLARARVRGKELEVSGERYKALILPAMSAVRFSTMQKALELYRAGGIVLAIGALPVASERVGRGDPRLRSIVKEIFGGDVAGSLDSLKTYRHTGKSGGKGIIVPGPAQAIMEINRGIQRDFEVVTSDSTTPWILHRSAGQRDIYFVYGAPQGTECSFRARGRVELWNPWDGSTRPLPIISVSSDRTRLRLPLTEKDPQLIVFTPGIPDQEGKTVTPASERDSLLLGGEWEFEVRPTLDNRWGDYRLPAFNEMLGPEASAFLYAPDAGGESPRNGNVPVNANWDTVASAFGPQFWKLGPLPSGFDYATLEAMLSSIDSVDPASPLRVDGRSFTWAQYEFSWRWGLKGNAGHQGYHGLKGVVHNDLIGLGKLVRDWPGVPSPRWEAEGVGSRYYLWSTVLASHDCQAVILQNGIRPSAIWVNHQLLNDTVQTVTLRSGANPVVLRFDTVGCGHVVFEEAGIVSGWRQTLPLSSDWYGNPSVLPFDIQPRVARPRGWFRCTAPPGLRSIRFAVKGQPTIWVNGSKLPVHRVDASVVHSPDTASFAGRIELPTPMTHSSDVVMLVEHQRGFYGGAAIPQPMMFDCSAGMMELGDLSKRGGLETYAGGMEYRKSVQISVSQASAGEIILDLGNLVSSAEVRVNGQSAGTRPAPPWRFDLSGKLRPGENRVEVVLYNTVGTYYQTVPSQYIGKITSGLLGPVTLSFRNQK